MRPFWMIVVVTALAMGNAHGQEPAPTAPLADAARAPTAAVAGASNSQPGRPSLGTRLANWRPISRWLSRTSARQEPVAIPAAVNTAQPAQGTDGSAPPVPAVIPLEGDPGTTPPGPSGPRGRDRGRHRSAEPRIGPNQLQPGSR